MTTAAAIPIAPVSLSPSTAIVRDEVSFAFDGMQETWRLEWRRPPVPDCMGAADATTCACTGFSFGERGELDLVRIRGGSEQERLHLAPLFEEKDARLVRWDASKMAKGTKPDLSALASVPPVSILQLRDFDHDGRATEFLLQLSAGPCGHTPIAVVGVSRTNIHLHVFSTVEAPKDPFTLDHRADWEKLAASAGGTTKIVQVECDDHGADHETTLNVRADGELHAALSSRSCPDPP